MSTTTARQLVRQAHRAWLKGQEPLAQDLLAQARAQAPGDACVQSLMEGFSALWRGKPDEARARFDEALGICPDGADARAGRMLALRALADDDETPRACTTYVCASVTVYRKLADRLPQADDVVVELGASTGKATWRLARRARRVIAVEKSHQMVEMARVAVRGADNVTLVEGDARQLTHVLSETARADCVFVDVSGSAPPWSTLRLAEKYRRQLRPRCLVVRSTGLARFTSSVVFCEGRDDEAEGEKEHR